MSIPDRYVLDCSVTLSWFFEDEASAATDALLLALPDCHVVVPSLWFMELGNALNVAVRRKRVEERRASQFLDRLGRQNLVEHRAEPARLWREARALASRRKLSVYDAVYLDLARQSGLPLASLDRALRVAADAESVPLVLG